MIRTREMHGKASWNGSRKAGKFETDVVERLVSFAGIGLHSPSPRGLRDV